VQPSHELTARTRTAEKLSSETRLVLIVCLVIISVFPIALSPALADWPPEFNLVLVDLFYLCILISSIVILTGKYRPGWFVKTMITIEVISASIVLLLIVLMSNSKMS
jgi:uncharacterized membrane protein